MDDARIDWTGIATIEAQVRHFGEPRRDEVIRRRGRAPADHESARDIALRALAAENARQTSELTEGYASAFAAEQARLRRDDPPIESLGELPLEVAPPQRVPQPPPDPGVDVPVVDEPARVATEPASPRAPLVPSYLRDAASAPGALPAVAAPVVIQLGHLRDAGPDSTQQPFRNSAPVLPFAEAADAPPPPPRDALPFPEDDPTRIGTAGDGDETAFLPRRLFDGPATPFEKKKAESAATVALDQAQLPGAPDPPEPSLPIEEYAAFLGELARDPSRAGVLRAKFGIAGEDAQRALGAAFAARFHREPGLRARFDALVAEARAKAAR